MVIALWILGAVTSVLFAAAGAVMLFASKRRLASFGALFAWTGRLPAWLVKAIGLIDILAAVGVAIGLLAQDQYGPLAWWLIAVSAVVAILTTVIAVLAAAIGRREPGAAALPAVPAIATVVIASMLALAWPGGVPAPTMPIPDNPLWTGDSKPDPVPPENVVLSLPDDMYRHKDAPTEWWWHIGTLRAGDRVFGFEINAASFTGQSFAMTQVSLSDVEGGQHYEHTQVYAPKPIGNFDVATWAEGTRAATGTRGSATGTGRWAAST